MRLIKLTATRSRYQIQEDGTEPDIEAWYVNTMHIVGLVPEKYDFIDTHSGPRERKRMCEVVVNAYESASMTSRYVMEDADQIERMFNRPDEVINAVPIEDEDD